MYFVDTNVLVYGFDDGNDAKRERSQAVMRCLWETRRGCISAQVLQEFYVTATRKLTPRISRDKARREMEDLFLWKPVSPSLEQFQLAWEIEDRWQLSWWDSLIVAAAKLSNCTTLLTEDLQDGLDLDGLRVTNPFAPEFDPASL
jgi:predicted nucleic acid-binding protein